MRILDTHLHLIYPQKFNYPWLEGVEPLNKLFSADDYFDQAVDLGIESALHMEVDVAEEDMVAESAFVASCHPRIVGAIAAARPESHDFAAHLEHMIDNEQVKGFRRILHQSPNELSQSELFRENISRLASVDIPFDLCVRADQLSIGYDLVKSCPNVQFILDHCGVPKVAERALDPWRDEIRRLAELPNVVGKISGIVAYAGEDWTVDDLRPFAEHVIESFGWDRVVWGSDHPVCTLTANLKRWVDASFEIVRGTSENEQARLFHANAERIYKL